MICPKLILNNPVSLCDIDKHICMMEAGYECANYEYYIKEAKELDKQKNLLGADEPDPYYQERFDMRIRW